jgi:hypothetical protein
MNQITNTTPFIDPLSIVIGADKKSPPTEIASVSDK